MRFRSFVHTVSKTLGASLYRWTTGWCAGCSRPSLTRFSYIEGHTRSCPKYGAPRSASSGQAARTPSGGYSFLSGSTFSGSLTCWFSSLPSKAFTNAFRKALNTVVRISG